MNKSNFLDAETAHLDSKLRIIHNEFEDNLNELLGGVKDEAELEKTRPYKIIKPDPGFCVKAHRVSNNEKCFINICTSDGIPAPEDISADQLTMILSSETPSNYKIPMSITELRLTPDKSGKDAVVCDVAIHPQFFRKVEALVIFRDFLITIIFEALDTKYSIQINRDTWIILKNRKCIGTLEKHRVQNRDVQKVYESYQNQTKEHKTLINEFKSDDIDSQRKSLITEIDSRTSKTLTKSKNLQTVSNAKTPVIPSPKIVAANTTRKPDCRLFKTTSNDIKSSPCAVAEFFLPEVMAQDEFSLDLGRDRVVLEARRAGYLFDSFFPFDIDVGQAKIDFDPTKHILTVKVPLLP
ncbi:PIH1 domain-containing protein 1 [Sitodiplosis mosellana]|uniref:PIH1 domain-containing protein 1 n=1 Tax=Sitodiplosis mosellana TaxID=263140 RepID=UPI002444589E|nr:PIH1 domain-containing protein 1 [Sitodiplosis mosellana]